jgi:hypothetical protein
VGSHPSWVQRLWPQRRPPEGSERVFEEYETEATDKPTLQLRVPLPDSQYVNLTARLV